MMKFPLTLAPLLERAGKLFPNVEIVSSPAGQLDSPLHLSRNVPASEGAGVTRRNVRRGKERNPALTGSASNWIPPLERPTPISRAR
jgi:hypothetical protein